MFFLKKIFNIKLLILVFCMIFVSGFALNAAKQKTIRVLTANHPWKDAIVPLIPQFEKATGIKVNLESFEETQLTPKLTVEFNSGSSTVDVFMTRPLQEGRLFAKNKWYQTLDAYISKTQKTWNWKDYPEVTRQAVSYENKIYAVPLVTEWEVLFYRKDLLDAAKISVPKNLVELEAAAKALNNPKENICGIVSRGQRNPSVTQFSSYLYAYGGDFIKDGKCVLDSPQAINAIKYYGKLLANYGPPGSTNIHWPQAIALFSSGKAAMWTDASVFCATVADPAKSQVADKLGIAPFPSDIDYMIVSWALAMGNQAKNKAEAWKFIEWATSPEITKKAQIIGNTMARTSVWEDKDVLAKVRPDLAQSMIICSKNAKPYDRPMMTSVVEARDAIGDVIVKSIETSGGSDIDALIKDAVKKVNDLLIKAGEGPKKK
jgi:multiple sugar transport system substrate-binding protein